MAPEVLVSFPHALGAPGIGTTAWYQVRELARAGVRVTVAAASVTRPLPPDVRVVTTLTVGGRRIPHRAVGVGRAYGLHDARVARMLVRRRPDVVHVWPRAVLRTAAAARRSGIPVVREAPSAHTAEAFAQSRREQAAVGVELPRDHAFRSDAARLALEEREFAAVDALLVPSQAAAETYVARGIPQERVLRHRYGFDPERFVVGAPPAPDPFTAVVIGRVEPTKGVHLALDAWRRAGLPAPARLLVVGSGLPDYEAVLRERYSSAGVERRPFVDDVATLLRSAHVLVLASVTEGSALVTYEAQGSGVVLAVSDAAGAWCRPGVDALVHPARDVDQLGEHLRLLHDEPARWSAMRAETVAVRDELTWAAAAARLAEIYAGLAAG